MSRGQRKTATADATVTFTYESAYNQIVEPGSYVSLSQYFIAHWMPAISGPGLKILIQLRSMGYYNPKAGVQRGDVDIDQKDLAALCGMGLSTLKRAFLEDEVLTKYVQRVFDVKRDPRTGRIVREHYVYAVKMDDVLTPSDRERLEGMLLGPEKGGADPSSPKGQNELSEASPIVHIDPSAVQNEPPMVHIDPPTGQNELSFKRNLNTSNTLTTSITPAAPPDSLSLFEEPEKTTGPPWPSLTEAERSPWLDRARQEIAAAGAGSAAAAHPGLVETRARNLYRLSHR